MYSQIRTLMTNLAPYFKSVTLTNDTALQKPDNAVLFIDRITVEYLTSTRKRKHCEMAIMFSLEGTSDTVYQQVDSKIVDVENVLESTFNYYEINEMQFSYVANIKRLFVFLQVTFQWEE
ncbi:hypothetical protein [Thermosipho sp. 1074]|uniref:hypothetical protein n=1 Tax=Thermosipho sp. 1074 TaxID=1643331 RepID=UPI0009844640|nr:hypothetical protein [Thermosipho sp. 1074]OOC42190.1 hypothetical protein XO08_07865 [Thermosipho sp. 1074]